MGCFRTEWPYSAWASILRKHLPTFWEELSIELLELSDLDRQQQHEGTNWGVHLVCEQGEMSQQIISPAFPFANWVEATAVVILQNQALI